MPVIQNDDQVREILATARTIAVPGLSDKPWRDSHSVSAFMLARGYSVIPVNPMVSAVFGIPAAPSLSAVRGPVDIVNVFRRPEHVPEIVEDAVALGIPTLWLQPGTVHEEAVARASGAGMNVVADRCIRVAYSLLLR
jgi:predicted CoA-binding protein